MIGSRIISGLLFTTLALFGYILDSFAAKSPHISKFFKPTLSPSTNRSSQLSYTSR